MDGCYISIPCLNKNDDPNDIALNAGWSIFVDTDPYWEYMSNHNMLKSLDVCSFLGGGAELDLGELLLPSMDDQTYECS